MGVAGSLHSNSHGPYSESGAWGYETCKLWTLVLNACLSSGDRSKQSLAAGCGEGRLSIEGGGRKGRVSGSSETGGWVSWLENHVPPSSRERRAVSAGRAFGGRCSGERRGVGGCRRRDRPKISSLEGWLPAPSQCWREIVPLNLPVSPMVPYRDPCKTKRSLPPPASGGLGRGRSPVSGVALTPGGPATYEACGRGLD